MDPKVWGPSSWLFMHCVTLSYPNKPSDNDKHNIKQFFIYMGKVLPCIKCRHNFKNHLNKHPLNDKALSSRENLVNWLIDIHNEVNATTGKPPISHKAAIERFSNLNDNSHNISLILTVIIIIIIVMPFIFMKVWK